MAIDSKRFNVPMETHIRFLKDQIDKWFFLPTARMMARKESARRKGEMDRVRW
jgi:hypothetical protein